MLPPRKLVLGLALNGLRCSTPWTCDRSLGFVAALTPHAVNPVKAHDAAAAAAVAASSAAAAGVLDDGTNNIFAAEDGDALSSMYERAAWVDDVPFAADYFADGDSFLRQPEKRALGRGAASDEETDLEKRWPPNPKWTTARMIPPSTTIGKTTTTTPTKTTTIASTTTTNSGSSPTYVLATPASSCSVQAYTNLAGGAVYGAQKGNVSWHAVPSTFVKRAGQYLTLDGNGYRIVGPNIYWLGLDENVNNMITYPDKARIREVMANTVAMGGNTIRSHSLGISTGNSLSLWPTAYNTNKKAFDSIDYAIYAANAYGLRLIIPLTDQYTYYHGGKYDFIRWAGGDTSDGNSFYWNSDVIKIFKDYIAVLLNHVNAYTGLALKNDPTIMAWETGNELGGYALGGGAPPASWTATIATYINSIAPNQLIIDGTDGLWDSSGNLQTTGLGVSSVDIISDHFYPVYNWLLTKDQDKLASQSKGFFVGESDWTGQKGGDDLGTYYSMVESWDASGSMLWNMMSHDAQCCNWIYHSDGYSLYYPNGNTSPDLRPQILQVAQHWYRMRGLAPPSVLPAVSCPQLPLPLDP